MPGKKKTKKKSTKKKLTIVQLNRKARLTPGVKSLDRRIKDAERKLKDLKGQRKKKFEAVRTALVKKQK